MLTLSALLFGGAALWLLLYLLRILLTAAGLPLGGAFDRWWLNRHIQRALQADRLLQVGNTEEALPLLRDSFCLTPFRDLDLIRETTNHHAGVLSRILTITAETVRPLSLAKVDRLLRERRELHRTWIAARQSPGKRDRTRELAAKLQENQAELQPAIRQMIEEVRSASRPIYH